MFIPERLSVLVDSLFLGIVQSLAPCIFCSWFFTHHCVVFLSSPERGSVIFAFSFYKISCYVNSTFLLPPTFSLDKLKNGLEQEVVAKRAAEANLHGKGKTDEAGE